MSNMPIKTDGKAPSPPVAAVMGPPPVQLTNQAKMTPNSAYLPDVLLEPPIFETIPGAIKSATVITIPKTIETMQQVQLPSEAPAPSPT